MLPLIKTLYIKVKVKVIHYIEGTVLVLALLLILTIYYSPNSVFAAPHTATSLPHNGTG